MNNNEIIISLLFLSLLVFLIFQHVIISKDLTDVNQFKNEKDLKYMENLLKETKIILNDILSNRSNLPTHSYNEIKRISADELQIEKEVAELKKNMFFAKQELDNCKNFNLRSVAQAKISDNKRWLVIGIPTVSRKNNEQYLLQTLDSIASQLPLDNSDLLYHKILIVVCNMQINNDASVSHIIYQMAKEKYENSPLNPYFKFVSMQKDEILPDPVIGATSSNDRGSPNKPGFLVRRQTRNIAYVIEKALNIADYYLFLEDDMQFCPQSLLSFQYLISKANEYHQNWIAIRASYGMNGIFMRNKDLEEFSNYLLKHQTRRPPDHLVVEWYAGETKEALAYRQKRVNIGFKYNLFNHLGIISTLRNEKSGSFPGCYDMLVEPTVFKVEAYNPIDCPLDDIWPCKGKGYNKKLIDWSKLKK